MAKTLAGRIVDQIIMLEDLAINGKWRKDVNKFDLEQAAKDKMAEVEKTNKAIKDRRGIKE